MALGCRIPNERDLRTVVGGAANKAREALAGRRRVLADDADDADGAHVDAVNQGLPLSGRLQSMPNL